MKSKAAPQKHERAIHGTADVTSSVGGNASSASPFSVATPSFGSAASFFSASALGSVSAANAGRPARSRRMVALVQTHGARLFWAFSGVVAMTFLVSVFNFVSQTVLTCPEGTELVGGPPPQSFEAFCAIEGTDGAVRHGPYRRWFAASSAYKGSRLAPDILLEGQYSFSEKTGVWRKRSRYQQEVVSTWKETPRTLAYAKDSFVIRQQ